MILNKKYISEDFSDYHTTELNNKFGIADCKGNQVIEPVFDRITIDAEYTIFELEGCGEAIFPTSKLKDLK